MAAPTASPAVIATMVTASTAAQPTGSAATAIPTIAETQSAVDTATPIVEPTATPRALPAAVTALADVTVQDGGSARFRNQPGGDTLVAVVPSGTQVEVLGGKVDFNNIDWLQIWLPGGQVGWIADFPLRITQTYF